jgi:hypothetical protein
MSREHTVSQCLFDDEAITVRGLPWCLDEAKTVGLSSLVRKILCKKHNSGLSELDSAALNAFNALREVVKIEQARRGRTARAWTIKRFVVDGPNLERWFLKTLINVAFKGQKIIGPGSHRAGTPSKELVEIVFGLRKFEDGAGLYVAGSAGQQMTLEDRVHFTGKTHGDNLVGATFAFRGQEFYLNLLPMRFSLNGKSQLLYRNAKLRYKVRNSAGEDHFSHEIQIRFPDAGGEFGT